MKKYYLLIVIIGITALNVFTQEEQKGSILIGNKFFFSRIKIYNNDKLVFKGFYTSAKDRNKYKKIKLNVELEDIRIKVNFKKKYFYCHDNDKSFLLYKNKDTFGVIWSESVNPFIR